VKCRVIAEAKEHAIILRVGLNSRAPHACPQLITAQTDVFFFNFDVIFM
jgi:hypothetical protein